MRARNPLVAIVAVLAIVAACGGQASPPSDPTAPASIQPVDAAALRYTCHGWFPFGAELVERSGTDEQVDDPLAAALRAHLAKADMEIDLLPDVGWTLTGRDATRAEFVAAGGDAGLMSVSLAVAGDGTWSVTGWGNCQPMRVLPDGLGEASWDLAPGQSIGPETTTFEAWVTERACASGRPSDGRVVGPDILALEGRVVVTFAVRPLGAGVQTCPSNPATTVTVVLPERLGERLLLDGSTLPPRAPLPEP